MSEYVRTLHFMWLDRKNPDATKPPFLVKSYMSDWAAKFPDWRIQFWNWRDIEALFDSDDELRPLKHKCLEEMPATRHHMCGPDLARLAVLYAHGGVYLDLNVDPKRGFDDAWNEFPHKKVLWAWEPAEHAHKIYNGHAIVLNSVIGVKQPRSDVIIRLIKYIISSEHSDNVMSAAVAGFVVADPVAWSGPWAIAEFLQRQEQKDPSIEPISTCYMTQRLGNRYGLRRAQECTDTPSIVPYCQKQWQHTSNWGRNLKKEIAIKAIFTVSVLLGIAVVVTVCVILSKRRERRRMK
jgi:hypothetical protein